MKNNFQKLPILFSLIFFLFLSFAFVFFYRTIDSINQKVESDMAVWQTEATRRDGIRSLDSSLQKIADNKVLLETHFAKSSDVVPFLDTIEKLASLSGIVAGIDSVGTSAENVGLVVGLKASGSFGNLYKFLTLLENSPYEINFLSMDLHKMTAANGSGKNIVGLPWKAVFKIQLLSFIP